MSCDVMCRIINTTDKECTWKFTVVQVVIVAILFRINIILSSSVAVTYCTKVFLLI